MNQATTMSSEYDTRIFSKLGTTYVWCGVAMLALGLLPLLVGRVMGGAIGTGLLFVFTGFWTQSTPMFRFGQTHLAYRPALLRAQKLIAYKDIVSIDYSGASKIFIELRGEDTLKLSRKVISVDGADQLISAFRMYASHARFTN